MIEEIMRHSASGLIAIISSGLTIFGTGWLESKREKRDLKRRRYQILYLPCAIKLDQLIEINSKIYELYVKLDGWSQIKDEYDEEKAKLYNQYTNLYGKFDQLSIIIRNEISKNISLSKNEDLYIFSSILHSLSRISIDVELDSSIMNDVSKVINREGFPEYLDNLRALSKRFSD